MSTTQQIEAAREHGYEGAERAAARAGEEWKAAAYVALCGFAMSNPGLEFTVEDMRERCTGIAPPPDGRAWGQVATRARRAGFIKPCGYAPTKSSNGSPKVLWRLGGRISGGGVQLEMRKI